MTARTPSRFSRVGRAPSVARPLARRRRERGVVAMEYILVAALVGLASVWAFAYLRRSVRSAIQEVAEHASQSALRNYYSQQ